MINQTLIYLAFTLWIAPAFGSPCHPQINLTLPQYIIGYGSLINEDSKKRTDPSAGENFPVVINGYERSWSIHGGHKTYLSVSEEKDAAFNAVIYQLKHPKNIFLYDKREKNYCRKAVHMNQLKVYGTQLPSEKQVWIYHSAHTTKEYPTEKFPVFQSYVDIFISGCLQMEEKFEIKHFAKDCIRSTVGWPIDWESPLVFPRDLASSYERYVKRVDHLMKGRARNRFLFQPESVNRAHGVNLHINWKKACAME